MNDKDFLNDQNHQNNETPNPIEETQPSINETPVSPNVNETEDVNQNEYKENWKTGNSFIINNFVDEPKVEAENTIEPKQNAQYEQNEQQSNSTYHYNRNEQYKDNDNYNYNTNDQQNSYNQNAQYNQNGQQNNYNPNAQYGQYGQYVNDNNQQDYYQNGQQTWSYNDYQNPQANKPKKQKKDKKDKTKNAKQGRGIKVFAIVVSLLLVVSVGSFGGYLVWDNINEKDADSANNNNSDTPTLNIDDTPQVEQQKSPTGILSPVDVNKTVGPSVVGVVTYVKGMGYEAAGEGSGVIINKDGYIVTNAHVVTDSKYQIAKIEVVLSNKETYTAQLVGADTRSDLAVLKITANNLTAASFGNSDKLQVGETAYVIGNPSGLQFAGSFTTGCISALDRKLKANKTTEAMTFIQTDAAINPGNSGGALANQYGQVIGISSAKIADEDVEGMGFAIPISIAKPVVDSIIENGYVKGRIKIGITYTSITKALSELYGVPIGLRVVEISTDSDVSKKDVKKGDIITKIGGKEVYDTETITAALEGKKPGEEVALTIFRVDETEKAKTIEVKILLSEDTSNSSTRTAKGED